MEKIVLKKPRVTLFSKPAEIKPSKCNQLLCKLILHNIIAKEICKFEVRRES